MTLDELFGGEGLDERLLATVRSVREGLDGSVEVTPPLSPDDVPEDFPVNDDAEPDQAHTITLMLSFLEQTGGALGWNWRAEAPDVLDWTTALFSDPLRGTHLFGAVGAELVAFFHDELGIEELYAIGPSDELKPIITALGMVELEPGRWGGPTGSGRMREYIRWRRGQVPEPGWRSGGERRPEVADDLAIVQAHLNGEPGVEPDPETLREGGPIEPEQPVT